MNEGHSCKLIQYSFDFFSMVSNGFVWTKPASTKSKHVFLGHTPMLTNWGQTMLMCEDLAQAEVFSQKPGNYNRTECIFSKMGLTAGIKFRECRVIFLTHEAVILSRPSPRSFNFVCNKTQPSTPVDAFPKAESASHGARAERYPKQYPSDCTEICPKPLQVTNWSQNRWLILAVCLRNGITFRFGAPLVG